MNGLCDRCNGTRQIGLPSFPVPCPNCVPSDRVFHDFERYVQEPRSFARLCAFVGYTDAQCITALVSETELMADEAASIVEEEYSRFARREADDAADEWLNNDGGDTARR